MDYIMLLISQSLVHDRMREAETYRLASKAGRSRRRLRQWPMGRRSVASAGCVSD